MPIGHEWEKVRTYDDSTKVPGHWHGLVPRDFGKNPVGSIPGVAAAFDLDFEPYPESEWVDRIREADKNGTWAWNHLRRGNYGQPIPNNYQDGWGYCWYYSTTHGVQIIRAVMGLPFIRLSAFAGAFKIKGGKNEGGWNGLSVQSYIENGGYTDEDCPNLKSPPHYTAEAEARRADFKITEGWMDIGAPAYDKRMSRGQYVRCLLDGGVVITDFNWWGHSVCAVKLQAESDGSISTVVQNSHDPEGNDHGDTVIKGSRAWPDNAVGLRAVTDSTGHIADLDVKPTAIAA